MTTHRPTRAELDRREAIQHLLALGLSVSSAAALLAACGDERGAPGGMGDMRDMPGWMMDQAQMDEQMLADMPVIRGLLLAHRKIDRDVEDIARGIRSQTTSTDPKISELIRTHVHRMEARLERGDPIRRMDPLFREIFEHAAAVRMEIIDLPDGVQVTETSIDRPVQLLIRQHAHRAVSEFVAEGMQRAMEPTPLPPGYT